MATQCPYRLLKIGATRSVSPTTRPVIGGVKRAGDEMNVIKRSHRHHALECMATSTPCTSAVLERSGAQE